jgi:O-antigen ligase
MKLFSLITPQILLNFLLLIWILSIPFKNSIYQMSTVLIMVYFLVYLVKNRDFIYLKEIIIKYRDLIIIFLLIILSMTISNFLNETSKTDAWRIMFSFIYRYAFIFFILIFFYSKNFFSRKQLFIYILLSLSIQSLDGLYQSIYGYDVFLHNKGSIIQGLTGGTYNRNIFALFMGIGVLLSFLSIKKINLYTKTNIFLFILFSLFIYNTLFSYSRAVWVSLFVAFLFYFIINIKNFKIQHLFVLGIVVFIIVLLFLNIESLDKRFEQLMAGNSSHRTEIWLYTLELIKQKPILGWGIDSFSVNGWQKITSVHNHLLELLLDTGIVGLITFLLLLGLIFKELIRNRDYELITILIYFLVWGNFGESIISGKTLLSSLVIFIFYIFSNRVELKNEGNK